MMMICGIRVARCDWVGGFSRGQDLAFIFLFGSSPKRMKEINAKIESTSL